MMKKRKIGCCLFGVVLMLASVIQSNTPLRTNAQTLYSYGASAVSPQVVHIQKEDDNGALDEITCSAVSAEGSIRFEIGRQKVAYQLGETMILHVWATNISNENVYIKAGTSSLGVGGSIKAELKSEDEKFVYNSYPLKEKNGALERMEFVDDAMLYGEIMPGTTIDTWIGIDTTYEQGQIAGDYRLNIILDSQKIDDVEKNYQAAITLNMKEGNVVAATQEPSQMPSTKPVQSPQPVTSLPPVVSELPLIQSEQPPVQSTEPSQPSQTPAPVTGDVDGNEAFSLGDVQMALKLALRIKLADKAINVENAKKLADVDGNGTVTLEDAQKLLKAALLIAPLE